jgi:hypothetical protein
MLHVSSCSVSQKLLPLLFLTAIVSCARPSLAARNAVATLPRLEAADNVRRGRVGPPLHAIDLEANPAEHPHAQGKEPAAALAIAIPATTPPAEEVAEETAVDEKTAYESALRRHAIKRSSTGRRWLFSFFVVAVFAQEIWWIFFFGSEGTSYGTATIEGGRGYCYLNHNLPGENEQNAMTSYTKLRDRISLNFAGLCVMKGLLLLSNTLGNCKEAGYCPPCNAGKRRGVMHPLWSLAPYVKHWPVFKTAPKRGIDCRRTYNDFLYGDEDTVGFFLPKMLVSMGLLFGGIWISAVHL